MTSFSRVFGALYIYVGDSYIFTLFKVVLPVDSIGCLLWNSVVLLLHFSSCLF